MAIPLIAASCSTTQDNEKDYPDMKLVPSIDIINKDSVYFNLDAERLRKVPNEMYMSSETYKVDIANSDGVLVFTTSSGKVFNQSMKTVEPFEVGDKKTFSYLWNGKNFGKRPIPPGEYLVTFSLPCQPQPYYATMKLKWEFGK